MDDRAGQMRDPARILDQLIIAAEEALIDEIMAFDPRKGERLIMVTDKHGATRSDFQAYARSKHASELMLPSEIIVLDKLPLLGSGKVDHMALQKFVREQAAEKVAAAVGKLL